MPVTGYAARAAGSKLEPIQYELPPLGPDDVEIAVTHCGICHSDVHMIDNDWEMSAYPLVPGHEIVGLVTARGKAVTNLKTGDRVGVGWQSGSCMHCEWCAKDQNTCCPEIKGTIVGRHGGFAEKVVVDSRFAFQIPSGLSSEIAAPLLCGGITVYSPVKRYLKSGMRAGIIGVGGLGHLGIRFAAAYGADVTAFSTHADKEKDARKFGARHFVVSRDPSTLAAHENSIDVLISTVTADLDWKMWMKLVRPHGKLVIVGASPGELDIPPFALIGGNRSVCGSMIGDPSAIQEMLQFAEQHNIGAQVEIFPIARVNEAVDRVRKSEPRYRAVLTF